MTDLFRLCLLVTPVVLLTACRPDPGNEEWTPPPAAAPDAELLPREECAQQDPLRQPFYGDLHVHTHYSMDARIFGTLVSPDDGYRFASGGKVPLAPFDEEDACNRPRAPMAS